MHRECLRREGNREVEWQLVARWRFQQFYFEAALQVARATSQEYELLVDFINQIRPDVKIWYLSSR